MKKLVVFALAVALVFSCAGAAFGATPEIEGGAPPEGRLAAQKERAAEIESGALTRSANTAAYAGGKDTRAYDQISEVEFYVEEMIAAKLLTYDAYDAPFYQSLSRIDLASYAMTLYSYLGGKPPAIPAVTYDDTDDPNAEQAYALGFFDYNDGYFNPDSYVSKGEAISVIAKAVLKVRPWESSYLPSEYTARAVLSKIYYDTSSISADHVRYIGFMNARGALLVPRGYRAGSAWIGAGGNISHSDFFLLLSDTAWIFARNKILPHTKKPAIPTGPGQEKPYPSVYKNNIYLTWDETPGAYSYEVSVYISKKLKKKIITGYASLSLNRTSVPTYKSLFGNPKKKKACFLKVSAMNRHGLKSTSRLKLNFNAERFVNLNHKIFGNKNRFGFKNAKAAKKYQKTIKVKVWKLSGKKKVKSSMWVTVNKELADDVKAIFAEIYKGKEKFPFKDMGGFQIRASKTSEHNHGTAIDINANENCMKDGDKVVVGKFWKPGKNPYSIKEDGDVVRAFAKYGWYWGGYGWGDRKDYMHFSFFGT